MGFYYIQHVLDVYCIVLTGDSCRGMVGWLGDAAQPSLYHTICLDHFVS